MKTLITTMIVALLLSSTGYAESPANIVNYGPSGGGEGSAGLCLQQLVYTQKDLEKQKFERDQVVRELNYRNAEEKGAIPTVVWFLVGVAAGGAAGYAAFHK